MQKSSLAQESQTCLTTCSTQKCVSVRETFTASRQQSCICTCKNCNDPGAYLQTGPLFHECQTCSNDAAPTPRRDRPHAPPFPSVRPGCCPTIPLSHSNTMPGRMPHHFPQSGLDVAHQSPQQGQHNAQQTPLARPEECSSTPSSQATARCPTSPAARLARTLCRCFSPQRLAPGPPGRPAAPSCMPASQVKPCVVGTAVAAATAAAAAAAAA